MHGITLFLFVNLQSGMGKTLVHIYNLRTTIVRPKLVLGLLDPQCYSVHSLYFGCYYKLNTPK